MGRRFNPPPPGKEQDTNRYSAPSYSQYKKVLCFLNCPTLIEQHPARLHQQPHTYSLLKTLEVNENLLALGQKVGIFKCSDLTQVDTFTDFRKSKSLHQCPSKMSSRSTLSRIFEMIANLSIKFSTISNILEDQ